MGAGYRDPRVVCYDHRGQGYSSRDAVARLDMDTLTADAAALIEELAPCHFVGSGMGGFVALRLTECGPKAPLDQWRVRLRTLDSSINDAARGAMYRPGVLDALPPTPAVSQM